MNTEFKRMCRNKSLLFWAFLIFTLYQIRLVHAEGSRTRFDQLVYDRVMAQCSQKQDFLVHGLEFVESMKFSYQSFNDATLNLNPGPIEQALRDRGLSPQVAAVLQSPGLIHAMQTCFPNDESAQNNYVLSMIIADTAGRGVGFVQGVVSIIISGKAYYFALSKAHDLFFRTKLASRLNSANKVKHIAYLTTTAVVLSTLYNIIAQYRNAETSNELALQQQKKFDQTLAELSAQINRLVLLLDARTEADEKCATMKEIKSLRNSYLELYQNGTDLFDVSQKTQEYLDVQNLNLKPLNSCILN